MLAYQDHRSTVRYLFDDTMSRTIPETSKVGRERVCFIENICKTKIHAGSWKALPWNEREREREREKKRQSPVALAYFLWRGKNAGSELAKRNVRRIFQVENFVFHGNKERRYEWDNSFASFFKNATRKEIEKQMKLNAFWLFPLPVSKF